MNWFVAWKVPAGAWWSRVPPPPPAVRLFPPEDLHLTVAFLGPVTQAQAEAAFECAPDWPGAAVDATLEEVVAMGNPKRPGALSAVVGEGREALCRGILAVRGAMLQRAGAPADDRAPLPHVTIARPKRSARRAEREEALAWARSLDLGHPRVRLDRLALYTKAEAGSGRLFREQASLDVAAGANGPSLR